MATSKAGKICSPISIVYIPFSLANPIFSGYAEFWNTESCEKAATLNGKTLLGRPIRIDWAE